MKAAFSVLTVLVMLVCVAPLHAQTQGMERRDDRRDDRAAGRAAKQDCKAGDEKTRAECRQEKRATKHGEGEEAAPAHGRVPVAQPRRAAQGFPSPSFLELEPLCE